MLKKLAVAVAALVISSAVLAQVGTTVKEGAKATGQKVQEVGDQAKAAVESEPNRTIDKTKAHIHKAKAHHHARRAKAAAADIPK